MIKEGGTGVNGVRWGEKREGGDGKEVRKVTFEIPKQKLQVFLPCLILIWLNFMSVQSLPRVWRQWAWNGNRK